MLSRICCNESIMENIYITINLDPQPAPTGHSSALVHGMVGLRLAQSILRGKSVRSWCDGSSDRSFME